MNNKTKIKKNRVHVPVLQKQKKKKPSADKTLSHVLWKRSQRRILTPSLEVLVEHRGLEGGLGVGVPSTSSTKAVLHL
jgi:hypothetical protein